MSKHKRPKMAQRMLGGHRNRLACGLARWRNLPPAAGTHVSSPTTHSQEHATCGTLWPGRGAPRSVRAPKMALAPRGAPSRKMASRFLRFCCTLPRGGVQSLTGRWKAKRPPTRKCALAPPTAQCHGVNTARSLCQNDDERSLSLCSSSNLHSAVGPTKDSPYLVRLCQ